MRRKNGSWNIISGEGVWKKEITDLFWPSNIFCQILVRIKKTLKILSNFGILEDPLFRKSSFFKIY